MTECRYIIIIFYNNRSYLTSKKIKQNDIHSFSLFAYTTA